MKYFRRFLNVVLVSTLILMGSGDVFAGLLTPAQLVRYNRIVGREAGYKITKEEYSAYRKLYPKLTAEFRAPMTQEEIEKESDLMREIERKLYRLSPKELAVYKRLSEDKCLNILLFRRSGFGGEMVYNGEYLGPPEFKYVSYATIAGDRLAYGTRFGDEHVIVDGEDRGSASGLRLTEDHLALIEPRQILVDGKDIGLNDPGPHVSIENHLIFDGKDMGTLAFSGNSPSIKGDHALFINYLKGEMGWGLPHAFISGKDIGTTTGYGFDIEGDNRLMTKDRDGDASTNDPNVEYNGAVIHRLGSGDTILGLALKDGHRVYSAGPGPGNNYHHIYYDGKDLGFGTANPEIEKDHLGYAKWPKNPKVHNKFFPHFVYDNKEYGPLATSPASLAGDHFAYLQMIYPKEPLPPDNVPGQFLARVNIDGKLYPGLFPSFTSDDAYVEISEKSNCAPK